MSRRKRSTILDESKRNAIVAVISVGCSQGVAARYAGCAPSTIRRAAAWALERGFPDKYAKRQPNAITPEQLRLMLAEFVEIIVADLPERNRKCVVKKVNSISRLLDMELKLEIDDGL